MQFHIFCGLKYLGQNHFLFSTGGLYSSLWASYMYFNMRIVTKNGDEIPFRHAVFNFVKSPAVQVRVTLFFWEIFNYYGSSYNLYFNGLNVYRLVLLVADHYLLASS